MVDHTRPSTGLACCQCAKRLSLVDVARQRLRGDEYSVESVISSAPGDHQHVSSVPRRVCWVRLTAMVINWGSAGRYGRRMFLNAAVRCVHRKTLDRGSCWVPSIVVASSALHLPFTALVGFAHVAHTCHANAPRCDPTATPGTLYFILSLSASHERGQ